MAFVAVTAIHPVGSVRHSRPDNTCRQIVPSVRAVQQPYQGSHWQKAKIAVCHSRSGADKEREFVDQIERLESKRFETLAALRDMNAMWFITKVRDETRDIRGLVLPIAVHNHNAVCFAPPGIR